MFGNTEVNMQILFVVRTLSEQCGCQIPRSIPSVLSFSQSQLNKTLNVFPKSVVTFLKANMVVQAALPSTIFVYSQDDILLRIPRGCTVMNIE